eukprot:6172266-Pleurochrysis_carterae.AAC.3
MRPNETRTSPHAHPPYFAPGGLHACDGRAASHLLCRRAAQRLRVPGLGRRRGQRRRRRLWQCLGRACFRLRRRAHRVGRGARLARILADFAHALAKLKNLRGQRKDVSRVDGGFALASASANAMVSSRSSSRAVHTSTS